MISVGSGSCFYFGELAAIAFSLQNNLSNIAFISASSHAELPASCFQEWSLNFITASQTFWY